jgi:hypothetical protein
VLCSIGEQSHKASLFNGSAQTALMLGAGPRFAAGLNFTAIRDKLSHEAVGIFVVNLAHMVVAELTDFAT